MRRSLDNLQPLGALVMRLVLGSAMIFHGYGKVILAHGLSDHPFAALQHFSAYVATLGLPAWLGYVSACTELFGGIFLVVGLLTRLSAILVAGNLAVALATVGIHRGFTGSELALALLALACMILFYGPGKAALDSRLGLS